MGPGWIWDGAGVACGRWMADRWVSGFGWDLGAGWHHAHSRQVNMEIKLDRIGGTVNIN